MNSDTIWIILSILAVAGVITVVVSGRVAGSKKEHSEYENLAELLSKHIHPTPQDFMSFFMEVKEDATALMFLQNIKAESFEEQKRLILNCLFDIPNILCEMYSKENGWQKVSFDTDPEKADKTRKDVIDLVILGEMWLRFSKP